MIVDAPYKADLLVYKANSTNQIENDGTIWHFVDAAYKANKKVYFVENEYQADIKVYFVEAKHQAKWINNEKRYLLQIE